MPSRVLKLSKTKRNPITFLAVGNNLSYMDKQGGGSLTASGALRYALGPAGRINYVPNPRAANDLVTITKAGNNTVLTRVIDPTAPHGTAVQTVCPGTSGYEGVQFQCPIPNLVNRKFQASFWIKAPVGGNPMSLFMRPRYKDGLNTTQSLGVVSNYIGTGDWQFVTLGVATPNTGKAVEMIYVFAHEGNTPLPPMTFWITDVILEDVTDGNAVGPYFDGSYPGCQWVNPLTGIADAAHASPSISKATFWVEEGTTNLLRNPSCEASATTGTLMLSGATRTQVNTHAHIGASSWKVDTPGSVVQEGLRLMSAASLGYTGSALPFAGQARVRGSGTVTVDVVIIYADATYTIAKSANITLTDSWQLVSNVITISNPAKTVDTVNLDIRTVAAQATTFYVDAAQVEQKAYSTSYCDGSLGTGYTWAGTAHASASTRVGTLLTVPSANHIANRQGFLLTGAVPDYKRSSSNRFPEIMSIQGGVAKFQMFFTDSASIPEAWFYAFNGANVSIPARSLGSVPQSPPVGIPTFIGYAWTPDSIAMILPQTTPGPQTTASRTNYVPTDELGDTIRIGGSGGGTAWGVIGPVALFDRPLTQAELTILQNIDPTQWWTALG